MDMNKVSVFVWSLSFVCCNMSLCKCVHQDYLSVVIVCVSCCLKRCIVGEGCQFVFWGVIVSL